MPLAHIHALFKGSFSEFFQMRGLKHIIDSNYMQNSFFNIQT